MQRRSFIHLSAYTALALTLPFADGCSPSTDTMISQPLLLLKLADKKTISEAGNAYLKLFPKEGSKTALDNLLVGSNASQDKLSIRKQLEESVLSDFKTGRTVTVSGWVLSITEARQCALFYILNT